MMLAFATQGMPVRQTSGRAASPGPDPEDERALMAEIAGGDRAAFTQLVDWHMTPIFRYAYGLLGDRQRAEDVTQETCLRLWRNADKWQPSGRVRSWLLRIAHNLCIDQMRGSKPQVSIDRLEGILPANEQNAPAQIQEGQVSRIVKQALFALPARQREALMLVHYSSLSNIEAAQIMGLSVDALESLLARGKKQMRQLLSDVKTTLLED